MINITTGSALAALSPEIPRGFWSQINHQLSTVRTVAPRDFAGLKLILEMPEYTAVTEETHRNGLRHFTETQTFFAGSGGDNHIIGALQSAGWSVVRYTADYDLVMRNPAGEQVSYQEGDLYLIQTEAAGQ